MMNMAQAMKFARKVADKKAREGAVITTTLFKVWYDGNVIKETPIGITVKELADVKRWGNFIRIKDDQRYSPAHVANEDFNLDWDEHVELETFGHVLRHGREEALCVVRVYLTITNVKEVDYSKLQVALAGRLLKVVVE